MASQEYEISNFLMNDQVKKQTGKDCKSCGNNGLSIHIDGL